MGLSQGCCADDRGRLCKCMLYPSELRLLGGFLAFFAGVLVLAFGMSILRPYIATGDFIEARCNTTLVQAPPIASFTQCRCFRDDNKCYSGRYGSGMEKYMATLMVEDTPVYPCYQRCESGACYSCFPCIQITVDYAAVDNSLRKTGAHLYKSRDIINENFDDLKCFHLSCTDVVTDNQWYVNEAVRPYVNPPQPYKCFYDKSETDNVIVEKVEFTEAFHSVFWPGLFCVIGLLMILSSFCVEARLKRKDKKADAKKRLIETHKSMFENPVMHFTTRQDAAIDTPSATENATFKSGLKKSQSSPSVPNIPLSDSARSSQMFAHAQAKSPAAASGKLRSDILPATRPHKQQRKVSIINLSTATPRGGHQNLAFVVTGTDQTDSLFADQRSSARKTPRFSLPAGSALLNPHEKARRSHSTTDQLDDKDAGARSPKFSLHRSHSFESLGSNMSEGFYPINFNPPSLIKSKDDEDGGDATQDKDTPEVTRDTATIKSANASFEVATDFVAVNRNDTCGNSTNINDENRSDSSTTQDDTVSRRVADVNGDLEYEIEISRL